MEAAAVRTRVEVKLGLPKGRMQDQVVTLLNDAGVSVKISERGYRPEIGLENFSVKLLKPQNILEMVDSGTRDVGFGGEDWVRNLGLQNLVELLDTGMDPVRLVVAAPDADVVGAAAPARFGDEVRFLLTRTRTHGTTRPVQLAHAKSTGKVLVVASEYEKITQEWIASKGINARFVRAFGATESFPPEDADIILDNTATGATLVANGLHIIDVVMTSTTRLFANRDALKDPEKKKEIDKFVLLLSSAIAARTRKVLEFNVSNELYETVLPLVPCMRAPTVSKLFHEMGFAVKSVVPKKDLAELLPRLKAAGATDLLVTDLRQVVP